MAFDPNAATATYMATLSPAAHAKATAYTQGGHWLLLWGCLFTILSALLILKSGMLVRLRDRLTRSKPRRNLAVFMMAIVFMLADTVIESPWTAYSSWWRERGYGLSQQPFVGWLKDQAIALPISVLMLSLFLIAVYALIRRAPRFWWLWSSAVAIVGIIFIMVIAPVAIEPLFNDYKPAPPGIVRIQVATLAKKVGVPSDRIFIFNGSKQSERYTANVSGLFGSARVAMSDTMFRQGADLAEVRGVVGHEMGHYVLHHAFTGAAEMSLLVMLALWLVDRLFPIVLRWTGESARIAGIADPAGLPMLMMIVSALVLLLTPLTSSITRVTEAQADQFSLDNAHEPDGLSRALVKTIAYRASSPSRIEEILFYDHPSVERRVRHAMEWKAAHPDLVGK